MKIRRFTGLDSENDGLDVGFSGLTVAKNIDIDRKGRVSTRNGYSRLSTESIVGGFSDGDRFYYLTSEGALKRDDQQVIAENLIGSHLVGVKIGFKTYFSTGFENGVIYGSNYRVMGVDPPVNLNLTSITQGLLPEGSYLVAATSVAEDGRESSSTSIKRIDIDGNNKGIQVDVKTPHNESANIYISDTNGTELYYLSSVNEGSILITDTAQLLNTQEPLYRQYKDKIPPFDHCAFHRGYLLTSMNNEIIFSDPMDYEIYTPSENIIPFSSKITGLVSVESGFFVFTCENIFFVSGQDHKQWNLNNIADFGAINNTAMEVDLRLIGSEISTGRGGLFVSTEGSFFLADNQGQLIDLSGRRHTINNDLCGSCSYFDGSKYVIASY